MSYEQESKLLRVISKAIKKFGSTKFEIHPSDSHSGIDVTARPMRKGGPFCTWEIPTVVAAEIDEEWLINAISFGATEVIVEADDFSFVVKGKGEVVTYAPAIFLARRSVTKVKGLLKKLGFKKIKVQDRGSAYAGVTFFWPEDRVEAGDWGAAVDFGYDMLEEAEEDNPKLAEDLRKAMNVSYGVIGAVGVTKSGKLVSVDYSDGYN